MGLVANRSSAELIYTSTGMQLSCTLYLCFTLTNNVSRSLIFAFPLIAILAEFPFEPMSVSLCVYKPAARACAIHFAEVESCLVQIIHAHNNYFDSCEIGQSYSHVLPSFVLHFYEPS